MTGAYAASHDTSERMLLKDNDLAAMLSRIEGNVFVILTVAIPEAWNAMRPRRYPDMKRRFIPYDPAFPVFTPDKGEDGTTIHRAQNRYNLFACAESEISWDTGGGGVFTSSLVYHFDKGRHGIGAIMRNKWIPARACKRRRYKIRGRSGTAKNDYLCGRICHSKTKNPA